MTLKSAAVAVALLLAVPGCYHATIDTGLPPGTQTIHQPFASCWLFGLVPPKTVETMGKCPHGVAKVETQYSFLNWLVGAVTFGIYTPIEIKVTCGSGGGAELPQAPADIVVAASASSDEIRQAFMKAAELAVQEDRPVYVEY
ncbi:MAG TPA: hypothetical protein VNN55_05070 [bacterium]|nr:hypothetical protein [bacterium]